MSVVFKELSAIPVIYIAVEAHYIASKNPVECVLMGHYIYSDYET